MMLEKASVTITHYRRVNVLSGIVAGVTCVKSNEQFVTLICT